MAEKHVRHKKQRKPVARKRPKSHPAAHSPELIQSADRLSELPDFANAQPARTAAILRLQRQLGNAAVQRQIARQMAGQEEGEQGVAVQLPDPKSLRFELELEGHPFDPTYQREEDAGEETAKTTSAVITLKLKDPKINRIPEKKIQEKHGKEDIAGYTKPKIEVGAAGIKQYEINLTATISFVMDLAKEYKGGRLQVLRDHENAHILIAEKVANEFVVDPLKDELEGMPEFTKANKPEIEAKIKSAMEEFRDNEGDESEAYDDLDYPRMDEAYHGVATPLADLSSGSAEVKNMVAALDAFNDGAKAAKDDAASFGNLTQAIADAQDALGDTNLARLQYNEDFKEKVAKAQKIAGGLDKKADDLPAEVKTNLDELTPALEKFTWQPDVS